MVKEVWYLVTHIFRCKATNKFYNHFEDSTALIFMQEQNSQVLKAMLLKKKKFSLCWIGSNPGLNMLNFVLPSFLDDNVCISHTRPLLSDFAVGNLFLCFHVFWLFRPWLWWTISKSYKHARFLKPWILMCIEIYESYWVILEWTEGK